MIIFSSFDYRNKWYTSVPSWRRVGSQKSAPPLPVDFWGENIKLTERRKYTNNK
jgi:hypothetical protein